MSAFKDALSADFDTFINGDEFADIHEIDGIEIMAVVQGLTTKEAFTRTPAYFDAVHGKTTVVHCKTGDLASVPAKGNILTLDGEIYRVSECTDDMGICTIILEVDAV